MIAVIVPVVLTVLFLILACVCASQQESKALKAERQGGIDQEDRRKERERSVTPPSPNPARPGQEDVEAAPVETAAQGESQREPEPEPEPEAGGVGAGEDVPLRSGEVEPQQGDQVDRALDPHEFQSWTEEVPNTWTLDDFAEEYGDHGQLVFDLSRRFLHAEEEAAAQDMHDWLCQSAEDIVASTQNQISEEIWTSAREAYEQWITENEAELGDLKQEVRAYLLLLVLPTEKAVLWRAQVQAEAEGGDAAAQ